MKKSISILFCLYFYIACSALGWAAPVAYVLDTQKTVLGFDASATTHAFSGTVRHTEGSLVYDAAEDKLVEKVVIKIPILELSTGIPARDHSMQRMFEVQRYPDIIFISQNIVPISIAGSSAVKMYKVEGTLNIHGVEKALSFEADAVFKPEGVEVKAEVPVQTSWFGLVPPTVMGFIHVNPDVRVKFQTFWKPKP